MKERPMMFTGSTVQAILDGHKTQTRRLITPQPNEAGFVRTSKASCDDCGDRFPRAPKRCKCGCTLFKSVELNIRKYPNVCPYGVPGDHIWVKETWAECKAKRTTAYVYRADNPKGEVKRWRSSMFMPRRASRISLEIVEVRAERLQEITESDADAEGIVTIERSLYRHGRMNGYGIPGTPPDEAGTTRVNAYAMLWDSINKGRGEVLWNDNPFVWVITFKRI